MNKYLYEDIYEYIIVENRPVSVFHEYYGGMKMCNNNIELLSVDYRYYYYFNGMSATWTPLKWYGVYIDTIRTRDLTPSLFNQYRKSVKPKYLRPDKLYTYPNKNDLFRALGRFVNFEE